MESGEPTKGAKTSTLALAEEPLLNTDSEGLPRGNCQRCGCNSWVCSSRSVIGCRHTDAGASCDKLGEERSLCTGGRDNCEGDDGFSCECCGCPANAHTNLGPWLGKVQNRMEEFRDDGYGKRSIRPYSLPVAATKWHPTDAALFALTGGAFDPRYHGHDGSDQQYVKNASLPLVSVISPTCEDRHMFHPLLYECFCSQSYEPRELIVVDTGRTPSAFLEERARCDPRLVYRFFYESSGAKVEREARRRARLQKQPKNAQNSPDNSAEQPWSLGFKRNIACHLAKGVVIAHFDDDDLYASDYLDYMCSKLLQSEKLHRYSVQGREETTYGPFVATLSQWHLLDFEDLTFGFLDVNTDSWVPPNERHGWLYGWGFSYIFTRAAWQALPFPDVEFSEDISWVDTLMTKDVAVKVFDLPAEKLVFPRAIVAHTAHPASCTGGEYAGCHNEAGIFVGWVRTGKAVKMPIQFEHLMSTVKELVSSSAFEAYIISARKRDPDRNCKVGLRKKESFLQRLRCRVEGGRGVSVQRLPQRHQQIDWKVGGGKAPWC